MNLSTFIFNSRLLPYSIHIFQLQLKFFIIFFTHFFIKINDNFTFTTSYCDFHVLCVHLKISPTLNANAIFLSYEMINIQKTHTLYFFGMQTHLALVIECETSKIYEKEFIDPKNELDHRQKTYGDAKEGKNEWPKNPFLCLLLTTSLVMLFTLLFLFIIARKNEELTNLLFCLAFANIKFNVSFLHEHCLTKFTVRLHVTIVKFKLKF